MSGHVFVVRADPGGLHCDAWVPDGERRASSPAAHRERIRDGLDGLGALEPSGRRERPLIGVSAFPGGGRSAPQHVGEGLAELLPELNEAATAGGFDVALSAPDAATFAAAQALRRRAENGRWEALGKALRKRADELAASAAAASLALFLGAGVSASAGLPLWDELLDRLAGVAGMSAGEREHLRGLNYLDRAGVIEKRFGDPAHLQKAITELFTTDRYSLTHALLAALPVREVVTTNYDELFERAWADAGREFSALPHALRPGADSWVLKLHGTVSHAEDIVLTRADQYGYRGDRAALEGVVQALLITRHMLFVGFSLADDHFHKVADAVRRVVRQSELREGEPKPFGTTLVLRRNRMVEELWGNDLDWVCPADPSGRGGACAEDGDECGLAAARNLEVFLDYLLSRIPGPAYLLDERFESILTAEERTLRKGLLELASHAPAKNGSTAWGRVHSLLDELGLCAR